MNSEVLAIVGLTLIVLALPVMGAWAYQTFALKRELDDVARHLFERIERVEDKADAAARSHDNSFRDLYVMISKLDARLSDRKP